MELIETIKKISITVVAKIFRKLHPETVPYRITLFMAKRTLPTTAPQ